ncbi:MAG: M23 family metallopeptidase [Oscillospiraceae bacterium]|nr:M23 family metallopeptidase [Oscillospiraceae bacterium]
MNKEFFTNMQEQVEPSERLVSSLNAKIAADAAPKPANSFMKWLPLTAAACIMVAAMVLILPALMTAPPDAPFVGGYELSEFMTAEEIKSMTDEEFLTAFLNNEFIIPDIFMPDDFGIPLLEGESYSWQTMLPGGAVSLESAEQSLRDFWEDAGAQFTALEFTGENQYYYSFHTDMIWNGGYTQATRILIFKNSAMSGGQIFFDIEIHMLDKQSFTDIADIMFSAMWFTLPGDNRVIYRDVEETEEAYIYTYILAEKGPNEDIISLTERVNVVSKSTGRFIGYETITKLKRVSVNMPLITVTPEDDTEGLITITESVCGVMRSSYSPRYINMATPRLENSITELSFDPESGPDGEFPTELASYLAESTISYIFELNEDFDGTIKTLYSGEHYWDTTAKMKEFLRGDITSIPNIFIHSMGRGGVLEYFQVIVRVGMNDAAYTKQFQFDYFNKDGEWVVHDIIYDTVLPNNEPYTQDEPRELLEQALREIYGDNVRFIINFNEIPDSFIEDLYRESSDGLKTLTEEQLERILEQVYRNLPATPDKPIFEGVNFAYPLPQEHTVSEWHWSDGGYWGHSGLDFGAPLGTPIFAADSGKVTFAEWHAGYGRTVIIEHENGLITWYGHCSELLVNEGDFVEQGETIAKVGDSGRADGNQLHFEVRYGASILNPRHYLDFN